MTLKSTLDSRKPKCFGYTELGFNSNPANVLNRIKSCYVKSLYIFSAITDGLHEMMMHRKFEV